MKIEIEKSDKLADDTLEESLQLDVQRVRVRTNVKAGWRSTAVPSLCETWCPTHSTCKL